MATKQRIVYGSTCEWGTDGTTYTTIAEIKSLAVPEVATEYQDATHLGSPNGFREYIPGLNDAGEVTLSGGYSSGMFDLANGYRANKTLIYFRTTLPLETGQSTTGDVFTFTGYVTPRLQTNGVGEIISMDLVVRTSGDVTFVEGS